MISWNWEHDSKSIGNFVLNDPIVDFLPFLTKLERFESEDYDTYLIKETTESKIFTKYNFIASIQCGNHFLYKCVDLIRESIEKFSSILGIDLFVLQHDYDSSIYINKEKFLKVVVDKEGLVL